MTNEQMKQIRQYVLENEAYVQENLPYDRRHPSGRNAVAHFYTCLMHHYNVRKVKDIPSSEFNTVMEICAIIVDKVKEQDVSKFFPKVNQSVLDDFLC